ncbi:MAG TPA: TIGR03790 family protein [Steroidobacteraceae bacterium]
MNLFGWFFAVVALLITTTSAAEGLTAARLGVIYRLDDPVSERVALEYAARRAVPAENVIGIHLPNESIISPQAFSPLRAHLLTRLPSAVQSLLLIWSRPYAVGCMSITTAFAAGYDDAFCLTGCVRTPVSPLFNGDGWLPADTVGWWPAMLLPSDDVPLAFAVIERGKAADASRPPGTLYLIKTDDAARNVRAEDYATAQLLVAHRLIVTQMHSPIEGDIFNAIGYFTGVPQVEELPRIRFRPGAVADHLTSTGGILEGGHQMSALMWLKQGATASYGSVSEPCNLREKFPDVAVLFEHYLHGETILEAYWKSVAMPGQGLFIGEPLARPFAGDGK